MGPCVGIEKVLKCLIHGLCPCALNNILQNYQSFTFAYLLSLVRALWIVEIAVSLWTMGYWSARSVMQQHVKEVSTWVTREYPA